MKIFKKPNWRMILIGTGMMIFLFVIYDSIKPYFPRHSPYPYLESLKRAYESVVDIFIGISPSPPASSAASQTRHPHPAARRGSVSALPISSTINTRGQQQLWVWELKPERKASQKIRMEIAHAAPGEEGGFYMVAYADTNNDGKPDREIEKSPFRTAKEAGEWSVCEFETEEKRIFVGNAWAPKGNSILYRAQGNWPEGADSPLESRFYYQVDQGSGGGARSAGPAYTNLKISFPD